MISAEPVSDDSSFTIKTFDEYSSYYGDKQHRIIKADPEKFYSKANAIKNKL